ncbi:MAG: glycosyltransferase [Bacteroidota bacterium]
MEIKVSVLLLTYNQEKYIAQAINSVLDQKVDFDFEILIGEDCSTDRTREIAKEFALNNPEKIKLVISDRNVGPVKNEKRLVEAAKGKYLAFLEGDDFWTDPLKLQKQTEFLEKNPDYGLVHGDVNHFYENAGNTQKSVNKLTGKKIPQGNVFDYLLKPDPLFIKTATAFFRKELVTRHFDYELALSSNWPLTDLPLWMDITYHSKAHYFDEVFATYRLLNESASRTASPIKKYNYFKGLYKIKQIYLTKYNCSDKIKNELEEDYYRNLMKMAFNLNDNALAEESITYLKEKNHMITSKERLMLLSTKNKLLRRAIQFIKT